jgi:hypothetical protein
MSIQDISNSINTNLYNNIKLLNIEIMEKNQIILNLEKELDKYKDIIKTEQLKTEELNKEIEELKNNKNNQSYKSYLYSFFS